MLMFDLPSDKSCYEAEGPSSLLQSFSGRCMTISNRKVARSYEEESEFDKCKNQDENNIGW